MSSRPSQPPCNLCGVPGWRLMIPPPPLSPGGVYLRRTLCRDCARATLGVELMTNEELERLEAEANAAELAVASRAATSPGGSPCHHH